jgi:aspartate-semialdehyde dehydrogenase
MSVPRIAVVGASTLIGEAVIAELRLRDFPSAELHALDDERGAGGRVGDEDRPLSVGLVAGFDFARADLVFFCGRRALSERYAEAAAAHAWVLDGSAHFRGRGDVPLIAADVNAAELQTVGPRGLIALPGSASVALATALGPLESLAGLERVEVATYQAVSGNGRGAVDGLAAETVALLNGKQPRAGGFGQQIAFNVIPQVDAIGEDGVSREEHRIWQETRRLLGLAQLPINVTAVRVPVFFGHGMAVHVSLRRPATPAQALGVLQRGTGIRVIDAASSRELPTPAALSTAPDRVYIARMRSDPTRDLALNFWIVADNVRKCAAHNAVSVAQILVNRPQ